MKHWLCTVSVYLMTSQCMEDMDDTFLFPSRHVTKSWCVNLLLSFSCRSVCRFSYQVVFPLQNSASTAVSLLLLFCFNCAFWHSPVTHRPESEASRLFHRLHTFWFHPKIFIGFKSSIDSWPERESSLTESKRWDVYQVGEADAALHLTNQSKNMQWGMFSGCFDRWSDSFCIIIALFIALQRY